MKLCIGGKLKEKIKNNIDIIGLYFFMICGAVWNIFDVFQDLMKLTAPLVIPILASYMIYSTYKINNGFERFNTKKFTYYLVFVFVASWIIELIGIKTGLVFGAYKYGDGLNPKLFDVPISIGLAWIMILLSSVALTYRVRINFKSAWKRALVTGLFMLVFDFFMEPTAMLMNYWEWQFGIVNPMNYLAWFVIGTMLAKIGYESNLFMIKTPRIVFHAYFAQLIFFIGSYF